MHSCISAGALALALISAPALAQDRIVPTKAPSQVDAALAVVVVDPATGAPTGSNSAPLQVQTVAAAEAGFSGSVTAVGTPVTVATTGYGYIEFGFTSVGSGNAFQVDCANDGVPGNGTSFGSAPWWAFGSLASPVQNQAATPSTGAAYVAPVCGSTMRIRVPSYTSGTVTVVGSLKRGPVPPPNLGTVSFRDISNNNITFFTTNVDGSGNGTLTQVPVSARNNLFNGTTWDRQYSGAGEAAAGAGLGSMSVEENGKAFSHISTNTTITVKSGKGNLDAICVNTKGASANVATIYDNTAGSGTVIAVLDTTAQVGCLPYHIAFTTGLTVVTVTGTAADLTVSYR